MCDTTFSAQFPSTYTSIDLSNASTYARMKLLHKKVTEYNASYAAISGNAGKQAPLEWVHRFPGGNTTHSIQTSYPCDQNNTNLNCFEGIVRVTNRQECESKSRYDPNHNPTAIDGWYLQWLPPKKEDDSWNMAADSSGDCYMGNYYFRKKCDTFTDDPEKNMTFYKPTGQCLINKKYCSGTGFKGYEDGPYPNGDGGKCELTNAQKVSDYFLGATVTRGIFGGACPFWKKI